MRNLIVVLLNIYGERKCTQHKCRPVINNKGDTAMF